MASQWDSIRIKKGPGGCGNVSEEKKNGIISDAVSLWEKMGLSEERIAFGIATMGVESGFNPAAKGGSQTERGLGQITDPTWQDAVKYHNKRYDEQVDLITGRTDEASQVRVMGAWIEKVWETAGGLVKNSSLQGYGLEEVAYGLWHQGAYSDADRVGGFLLSDGYNDRNIAPYFRDTYDEALRTLDHDFMTPGFSP